MPEFFANLAVSHGAMVPRGEDVREHPAFVFVTIILILNWIFRFGDTDPYRIRHKLLMGTQTDGGEMNHLLIYGLDTLTHSKYDGELQVVQRINHGKEVHRARIMPFNTNIIATRSPSSDVFIFDLATFPELPPDDNTVAPTLRLQGNTQEERDAR